MRLLIISDAPILSNSAKKEAYAPYVKEMDLWMQHASDVSFVCPTKYDRKLLTQPFKKQDFKQIGLRRLEFHTLLSAFISLITIPYQAIVLWNAMRKADHIHLRCPGNLALLASMIQVTLPRKRKTVKYAGNFDPHASQPLAYRWQKKILSNTTLTKNIDVLVYGEWTGQTKNIKSFFTATYSESDKGSFSKELNEPYQFIFVGTLSQNKNPQLLVELMEQFHKEGIAVQAHFYGDGPMMEELKTRTDSHSTPCYFYGNQNSEVLKSAYKKAHFSFLASQSEGWPKAVAESMWYGCIPIATPVSCVPWMLGIGEKLTYENDSLEQRGSRGLIYNNKEQVVFDIKKLISKPEAMAVMSQNALAWSQEYTIEKFEREIVKLIHS
ncbi:glycosyl transferase family 1 [Nonlabens xylanidelens]|uniref:Glycosyl transferase family 1 n=1 Tax=Nonlabens xylanidelens TaxID=191564 RepID=A0A2S6ILN0_9FLAO|nr:glycosyltransferase family 4 protein [Nonlabens xylanidelens]PPK95085.1 glycosyl transferase family 1 [Nonlabens xylanidelens]PQJ17615.1 glycosyl transferase family 1 [Nonlabens xylanidelens]